MRRSFLIGFTALALMFLTQSFPSAAADFLKDRPCDVKLKFAWPVIGTVSKQFGRQLNQSYHNGIDIQAAKGSEVRAAAPGEVLFAGWLRGYGNMVIIVHGHDYSTVYAHMSSSIKVRKGEAVTSTSTVIGAVGNTGTAKEPHLHFEVRQGSTPQNPLDYLKH